MSPGTIPPWALPRFEVTLAYLGSKDLWPLARALFGDRLPLDYDSTLGEKTIVIVGRDAFNRVESMRWIINGDYIGAKGVPEE